MVLSTLFGTAKLLYERKETFADTIEKVATKGGITEEGVKVLQEKLPAIFEEMYTNSIDKYEKIKRGTKNQLKSLKS